MNLLAVDTSSVACSVALESGAGLIERHELRPREHTRLLVPMIATVLREAGLSTADLDAVVLGNGPGSFIGMRIAASVVQGLCHGAGARLVPVSSLAAIADEAFVDSTINAVVIAQDAHMNEVYLVRYTPGADRLPVADAPVALCPVGAIDGLGDAAAAGAGWRRYPALWEANRARLAVDLDIPYPRAAHLLRLGHRALADGAAIDPAALEPAYVRARVATPPRPPASS